MQCIVAYPSGCTYVCHRGYKCAPSAQLQHSPSSAPACWHPGHLAATTNHRHNQGKPRYFPYFQGCACAGLRRPGVRHRAEKRGAASSHAQSARQARLALFTRPASALARRSATRRNAQRAVPPKHFSTKLESCLRPNMLSIALACPTWFGRQTCVWPPLQQPYKLG